MSDTATCSFSNSRGGKALANFQILKTTKTRYF